jgi:SAM-dependent methyltransferase
MAMSNLQVREDKNNQDHSVYVIRNDVLDDLPFKNGTFDLVTATQVLEHIEDVYSVLNAIHRVVKNDGVLIMSVPNIAYLQRRIAFLFGHLPTTCIPRWRWPDEGWDGDHVNYFTLEAVKMLLSQTGFEYLGCRGSGYIAGFRSLWPSLLSADLIFYAKCKKRKL